MNNKLDLAFKLMRQKNFIAKQNFACCNMCAIKQLNQIADERQNKEKPALGAVYYHRKEAIEKSKGNNFFIHFGTFNDLLKYEDAVVLICKCLDKADIEYELTNEFGEILILEC